MPINIYLNFFRHDLLAIKYMHYLKQQTSTYLFLFFFSIRSSNGDEINIVFDWQGPPIPFKLRHTDFTERPRPSNSTRTSERSVFVIATTSVFAWICITFVDILKVK